MHIKFSNFLLIGILSAIVIFGYNETLAHPHFPEGYPGGGNFTVTSQYKEYSEELSSIARSEIAFAVDPLEGCSCVIFRMDDLQDNYVSVAQETIMNDFINIGEFFSVGPIPIIFGSDLPVVYKTLEGYNTGLFEIFTHGWAHDDFSTKTLTQQTSNMTASQNALAAIFGTPPKVWIPPFNAMNADTLTAMDSNGLEIISADVPTDPGPNFVADGTSDIKDGLGIYHLPSPVKFIEYAPTPMRISSQEILDNIDSEIALRGYAVVTLHPQEFVNEPIGDPDVINATLYQDITDVIDGVIAKGYPIRTFEQVVNFSGTVSIDNVSIAEGNGGTTNFVFDVTRSNTSGSMSVDFSTSDNTATSPSDFTALPQTTLNFADGGLLTKTVTVVVNGDSENEPNEIFEVNLSNCVGCTITDSQGIGTITNDDSLSEISINDVALIEGDSGSSNFVFDVTRSNNSGAISVQYQTVDVSATSPSDYTALPLTTLNFADGGALTKQIIVPVNGDTDVEEDKVFNVILSNPDGCTIVDAIGIGTIINDDLPTISINDVALIEGDSGSSNFVFDVTRSNNSGAISVQYQTVDVSATSPSDFTALPLTTLNFADGGALTKTVAVPVMGEIIIESDETFNVNLSNCIDCTITDNQGVGTIFDNDSVGPNIQNFGGSGILNGEFNNPSDVAVDSNDRIIVADTNNNRIQIFDSTGIHQKSFGKSGSTNGNFNNPSDVTVDSNDRIIVADTNNNRIQIFDSTGIHQMSFGYGGPYDGQFSNPSGIAVDSNDRIIVADTNNNRIQIFDSTGVHQMSFGTFGGADEEFNLPSAVAVDSNDRIIVADSNNHRVQIFDFAGNHVMTFGSFGPSNSQFSNPTGIALKSMDRIIVADTGNNRIQIFDSTGSHLQSFGSSGPGDGQFNPSGTESDSTGRIVIADTYNHRIQIFQATNLDDLDSDGTPDIFDTENIIVTSKTINTSHTVGNVLVQSGAVLTIPTGLSLTITSGNNLTVESGGGVLINSDGTLQIIS